jgi:hypothetical protein
MAQRLIGCLPFWYTAHINEITRLGRRVYSRWLELNLWKEAGINPPSQPGNSMQLVVRSQIGPSRNVQTPDTQLQLGLVAPGRHSNRFAVSRPWWRERNCCNSPEFAARPSHPLKRGVIEKKSH